MKILNLTALIFILPVVAAAGITPSEIYIGYGYSITSAPFELTEFWDNGIAVSLGAGFELNDQLLWKIGINLIDFGFDKSAYLDYRMSHAIYPLGKTSGVGPPGGGDIDDNSPIISFTDANSVRQMTFWTGITIYPAARINRFSPRFSMRCGWTDIEGSIYHFHEVIGGDRQQIDGAGPVMAVGIGFDLALSARLFIYSDIDAQVSFLRHGESVTDIPLMAGIGVKL